MSRVDRIHANGRDGYFSNDHGALALLEERIAMRSERTSMLPSVRFKASDIRHPE
jgi:hypothetical protein